MTELIRVGHMVFEMAYMGVRKRGKRELREPVYQCPACAKRIFETSIADHAETHARRDDKSDRSATVRELGCTAKPLPGQLGFEALGVHEVRRP